MTELSDRELAKRLHMEINGTALSEDSDDSVVYVDEGTPSKYNLQIVRKGKDVLPPLILEPPAVSTYYTLFVSLIIVSPFTG
jgi:hypothetical protein